MESSESAAAGGRGSQPRGGKPAAREITNVGVLDLSAMESPEALDGVRKITNVGVILAPQALLQKLSTIPMVNVGDDDTGADRGEAAGVHRPDRPERRGAGQRGRRSERSAARDRLAGDHLAGPEGGVRSVHRRRQPDRAGGERGRAGGGPAPG